MNNVFYLFLPHSNKFSNNVCSIMVFYPWRICDWQWTKQTSSYWACTLCLLFMFCHLFFTLTLQGRFGIVSICRLGNYHTMHSFFSSYCLTLTPAVFICTLTSSRILFYFPSLLYLLSHLQKILLLFSLSFSFFIHYIRQIMAVILQVLLFNYKICFLLYSMQ